MLRMVGRAIRNVLPILVVFVLFGAGCDPDRIELVEPQADGVADFGRTAMIDAIVELSKTPKSETAYAEFVLKVEKLRPAFNREMIRDAELRLTVLAVGPLEAGLQHSAEEQMQAFATTVWPTILSFPVKNGEGTDGYIRRLCRDKLALVCQNIVPEFWAVMLNAQVWRTLKSRVNVAYQRCRWCKKDESFSRILDSVVENHLSVELEAQRAESHSVSSAWPKAGPHAQPLTANVVISFGNAGWVTVGNEAAPGGNWRQILDERREGENILGLHLRPGRMVGELLNVVNDANDAGYSHVALIARDPELPYEQKQYLIESQIRNFRKWGVHKSDTLQILVQALERQNSLSSQ